MRTVDILEDKKKEPRISAKPILRVVQSRGVCNKSTDCHDRLTHKAMLINMTGESSRMKETKNLLKTNSNNN